MSIDALRKAPMRFKGGQTRSGPRRRSRRRPAPSRCVQLSVHAPLAAAPSRVLDRSRSAKPSSAKSSHASRHSSPAARPKEKRSRRPKRGTLPLCPTIQAWPFAQPFARRTSRVGAVRARTSHGRVRSARRGPPLATKWSVFDAPRVSGLVPMSQVSIRFEVSRDEEHVMMELEDEGRLISLGSRAHH